MTAYDVEPGDSVHAGDPVTVDRYTGAARINHWITATCLVLLALSGLALFYPGFFSSRPCSAAGNGPAPSIRGLA